MKIANNKSGFYPADILLPRNTDISKWGVIACDQFTSDRDYWKKVENIIGDDASTYRLILPEAFLKDNDLSEKINCINETMKAYLSTNQFNEFEESLIYLERTISTGEIRKGIIGMLDLETYDYKPGSKTLTRASEGTIQSRIPPRAKIRRNACIELPHVMVLIDDPEDTVIGSITTSKCKMNNLYNGELMLGGGYVSAFLLDNNQKSMVEQSLSHLVSHEEQTRKYGNCNDSPLLFAVGDGNHSLATAKACYEEQKIGKKSSEYLKLPSRFALIEIVNIHDSSLKFEPIHRVLFDVDSDTLLSELKKFYPSLIEGKASGHTFEIITSKFRKVFTVVNPAKELCVASVQDFLDSFLENHSGEIDYVHDDEELIRIANAENNIGILLPAMRKDQFFKTIVSDGALPRKTFSMGNARDKRYYIECRKIR